MTNSELQQKRLVAAAIDGGIAIGLAVVLGIVQGVAGWINGWLGAGVGLISGLVVLAYALLRDILAGDRSIGKKTQGIRVTVAGGPVTAVDSVKRNLIFGLPGLLMVAYSIMGVIPLVGCLATCLGWPLVLLLSAASFAVVIIEIIKIIQDPEGVRFGDQFANTRVVL